MQHIYDDPRVLAEARRILDELRREVERLRRDGADEAAVHTARIRARGRLIDLWHGSRTASPA